MKIYIPNINFSTVINKELFILTRPFFTENGWSNNLKKDWNISADCQYIDTIQNADLVLLPLSINIYFSYKLTEELTRINQICLQKNITAYGIIGGDFGVKYPEFSNIIYFRMGGFRHQLLGNNKGFPVPLSDHFQTIFKQETIKPNEKNDLPIVGFCGHATLSWSKKIKEIVKCGIENTRRFVQNPFNTAYEPFFASAYERAKLLQYLEKSSLIKTNFIYRKKYRAGALTPKTLEKTTLEYYQNIHQSDYVVCVRGAGNFSARFYESLMLGKIPVFVNTDCLLPFEDYIDWKKHLVWVDWVDRKNIAKIIFEFHSKLTEKDFVSLQLSNRKLWKETLSVNSMVQYLK